MCVSVLLLSQCVVNSLKIVNTMDFYGKTMDFYGKTMDFYGKTMDFYGKMMDFYGKTGVI